MNLELSLRVVSSLVLTLKCSILLPMSILSGYSNAYKLNILTTLLWHPLAWEQPALTKLLPFPIKWPHADCFWDGLRTVLIPESCSGISWLSGNWPWPKWCHGSCLQPNYTAYATPVPENVPWHHLIYQHKSNPCICSGRVISNNGLFYFLKALSFCHAVFYMNMFCV